MVLRREQGGSREVQDVAAAQSGFLNEEGMCWRGEGWKLETFQDRFRKIWKFQMVPKEQFLDPKWKSAK